MFGAGTYLISSVKKVDGTESYFAFAEETGLCQNKERVEDCLEKDFLQQGMTKCKCIPYRLRDYTKKGIYFFTIHDTNIPLLNPKGRFSTFFAKSFSIFVNCFAS